MANMPAESIIRQAADICRECGVKHLSLFGSYAAGTQTKYSDLDFIVYGVPDMEQLKERIDEIPTLIKIDLFEYEICENHFASGSPRESLRTARSVGLIEDDIWMEMLRARNNLAHDYDGELAKKYFSIIISDYYNAMERFKERAAIYFQD